VYITLAICILCAVVLGIIHALGQYNTAEITLERLVATLAEGDVDTLMEDPELGFGEKARKDVRQRGLEEYNKIMAAFQSCTTVGLERYRSLRQTVVLRGEEAFKKLPNDEQREIRQRSRDEWILGKGLEELGPEAAGGIEEVSVFLDDDEAAEHVLRLGHGRLSEENEEALPPLQEIRSWAARPAKALSRHQKETLARVREAGGDALDDIRDKVEEAGARLFRSLSGRERRAINTMSRDMWILEEGVSQLDEEERMLVSSPEMFLEDADEEQQAREMCMLLLPPAKKALIEGRDYEDFTAKREDYIKSTGRERYVHFLEVLFSGCEYDIVETDLAGHDPFDLMRISRATFTLKWKGCPGAASYLGETLTFRFDGRSWRYAAKARPEPQRDEDEPPDAEDEEGGEQEDGS
jgi:hypothetical protein